MKITLPISIISLFIFLPLTALVGCASPEEQAAYDRQQQLEVEQRQKNAFQILVNQCEGYGFKRGTTAFAQCLQKAHADKQSQATLEAIRRKGTPEDPDYWFKKSQCFSTGRLDC